MSRQKRLRNRYSVLNTSMSTFQPEPRMDGFRASQAPLIVAQADELVSHDFIRCRPRYHDTINLTSSTVLGGQTPESSDL